MVEKVTKAMITDTEKFKSAWEKDAGSPYDSIIYYVIAALNIERDPELADVMMNVVVSKRDSMESSKSPSGLKLGKSARYYIGQFQEDKNIARSYLGASWKENYAFDKNNLTMTITCDQKVDDKT